MSDGQVIVTGASRGIGEAVARALESRGYTVACLSRSGHAPVGYGLSCDMTDEAAVRAAIDSVGSKGSVVGLVNNAGVHIGGPSAGILTADYEKVMALNATSVMIASREAHRVMRQAGGTIVNIGSFFDKLGVPENLAYCASKAAVAAITRCLAVEWAKDGITVMNVAPGYVETDLNRDFLASDKVRKWLHRRIPIGRPGSVEEVARLVGAIFAEKIGFLTGETIYIDGGQGMNH